MSHSSSTIPNFPRSCSLAIGLMVGVLLVVAPLCLAFPVPAATTTTLTLAPISPVTQGTVLSLQATVAVTAGGASVNIGSVSFYDGTTLLGAVQLVSATSTYTRGTANLKLRLGPGTHIIKAVYGGVNAYLSSTSSTQSLTVTASSAGATNTVITSSGTAGNYALTGKVAPSNSIAPTGMVSFLDQSNNNFSLGSVALNAATRTSGWQSLVSFTTAHPGYGVVMGDLNGDGIPDLVTSNLGNSTLSVLIGNGDGSFQAPMDYAVANNPFGLALGDVNGDGFPDIAVAFQTHPDVEVLLGKGDGTFQVAQANVTSERTYYVALADLNHDGNLDIVTTDNGLGVAVMLGNGDGTFLGEQTYAAGLFNYGLTVGDFNGDGNIDVAASDYSSGTISVLLGNGDGTLQNAVSYPVGTNPTNIVAADLDADGKMDLVVCNYDENNISVLLGNGDGTFKGKVDYAVSGPWAVATADVNGDGIQDVLATSLAGEVDLFQGVGDGTLLPAISTTTSVGNYLLALGDLNGDGVIDFVVPNLFASNGVVGLGSISATAILPAVSIPGGGSHNVVASYAGESSSAPSVSSPINLTGTQVSTSLALSIVPDAATPGQPVVLTANLTPSSRAGYAPSGSVIFFDGSVAIGTAAAVSNGHAVLTTSALSSGDHNITAAYSGDANFTASATSAIVLTVSVPDYTISASPATVTIRRGQTGTSTLTVTAVGGYVGPVAFTCSGLPQFATCAFLPPSVQLDGTATSHAVQFKVNTAATVASLTVPPGSEHRPVLALLIPFLPLPLISIARRRRNSMIGISRWLRPRWIHMLVIALFFLGVAGCGSSSSPTPAGPKVPLGTSSVTATAAAVGGSATHSATITVTVIQ